MRYIMLSVFLALFLLSSCGFSSEIDKTYGAEPIGEVSQSFQLSSQQLNGYKEQIQNTVDTYYWKYNQDSISYRQIKLPANDQIRFQQIAEVCEEIGYRMDPYGNTEVVEVTAELQHFNNNKAGTAHFYFADEQLIGVFYTADAHPNIFFSLKTRNIFTKEVVFRNYEDISKTRRFAEYQNLSIPHSNRKVIGKDEKGLPRIAVLKDGYIHFFRYGQQNFVETKRLSFAQERLEPISMVYLPAQEQKDQRWAVLLGTKRDQEAEKDHVSLASKKVVFLNSELQILQEEELVLSSEQYSMAGYDEGLILANGTMLEYYERQESHWDKYRQVQLGHGVQYFLKTDLDHDGIEEYVLNDDMDIYVYHKKDSRFVLIWRTNLSIENTFGSMYTGDLNGDGIQELYVEDRTGTVIRYILKEKGFISYNEDIEYGEFYFVGDFDGDGKDDYILSIDGEQPQQILRMAQ